MSGNHLLFFVILNIAIYIAIIIMSGDPFWIIHTGEWDGRTRVIAVLVIIGLNGVAVQAVEVKNGVDTPED